MFKALLSLPKKYTHKFFFSTINTQATNFVFPKKWEVDLQAINQTYTAIYTSKNIDSLAFILKHNLQYITDQSLADIYLQMARLDNGISDSFYNVIVPISQQYLKKFNRQNATAIGNIALSLSKLKINQPILWNPILKLLNDQNIYRYISLEDTVHLLKAMVDHGLFVNHGIVQKLHGVIVKQELYYKNFGSLLRIINDITPRLQNLRMSSKVKAKELQEKKKEIQSK